MAKNLRDKLYNKEKLLGCFIGFYSPAVAEILSISGFDFMVIDNEHGPFSWAEVEQMIRAAELHDVAPIVRVVDSERSTILKALDCGAQGIHVPQVSTAEEVRDIVQSAKFPPQGHRGVAWSTRSHLYGAGDRVDYLHRHNESSIVAVHIETAEAMENLDEMLSVPGLDIAYVGPADLSVSLGHAGDGPEHPQVVAATEQILETSRKHGLHVGHQVNNAEQARGCFQWGANYIGVSITPVLYEAFHSVTTVKTEFGRELKSS